MLTGFCGALMTRLRLAMLLMWMSMAPMAGVACGISVRNESLWCVTLCSCALCG